jgi:hypothetical protein
MSTPAQIEANRANSAKSTGPRTPEGKARSAENARTHGLTGRDLVILPGEEQEFDDLQTGLYEDVRPEGTLEDELFKALIHAAWNQRRCRRSEADLQRKAAAEGRDPLLDPALDLDLKRLDLYSRRAAGAFHRNMKALRDLQTERHTRAAMQEVHPEIKTPSLGLARLAELRQVFLKERTQSARAANAEIMVQVRDFELQRARFYAENETATAA